MAKDTPKKKKQPLERHKKVLENIGSGMTLGEAMKKAGYADNYADNPQLLRATKSWDELVKTVLSDERLARVHSQLLDSHRLDHMVFPLLNNAVKKGKHLVDAKPEQVITDEEIFLYFKELGCMVRKIVHGEQARHVYFWSPDNMARDKALEKAYKIKNKYAPEIFNLKFSGFSKQQLIDTILNKITKKK